MAASSDMVFQLRELPATRSFELPEAFVREALSAIAGQDQLDEPAQPGKLTVDVEVTEEQGTVFAHGHLAGATRVACNRCLGPVTLTVDEDVTLTFLPHEPRAEQETDVALDEEDLDVAVHDGQQVDLSAVLRDHIVLSVPYAPLCAESCKGLCPQCGINLNEGTCNCEQPAEIDSPWAALKNIKLD